MHEKELKIEGNSDKPTKTHYLKFKKKIKEKKWNHQKSDNLQWRIVKLKAGNDETQEGGLNL